jgi:copper(I)-binding protein
MRRLHEPCQRPARAGRNFRMLLLAAGIAGTILANAQACENLQIEAPWVREPPPGASAVAAFMTLRNTGAKPLSINSASAEGYGMGMFHETVRDGDKVSMRHRHAVTVPAGGALVLTPGGLHVMLMHPATAPRAGDAVPLTLGCGTRTVRVSVPVRRDPP